MERRSLLVAIAGVVLSAGVALASVAFWLGNLQTTVDGLLAESTTGAVSEARSAIGEAADEAAQRLEEVVAPPAILPVYSMPASLPPGWVICGSEDGTPSLGDRFLLGTTDVAALGDRVGGSHAHQLSGTTAGENTASSRLAPQEDGNPDYADNIKNLDGATTGDRNWYHEHSLGGETDATESLPPSVKVMFLCKVGGPG